MLWKNSDGGGSFQNDGAATNRSPSLHVNEDRAYIDAPTDYLTCELERVVAEARDQGWVPVDPDICDGDLIDDDLIRIWLVPIEAEAGGWA